ncbi:MAG: DNA-binding protein [Verrucomicrobiaceae bacterium]|nr:MAG: DNA-binding protein [Verrucomicrobiaceae bacterium]
MRENIESQNQSGGRVLRPVHVAHRLDVKVETVWSWCRSGKMPHIRLSARNLRIREEDLEAFLRSHTR